ERQTVAIREFLAFLKAAKPKQANEWKPAGQQSYHFIPTSLDDQKRQRSDAQYAASLLEKSAEIWRRDRESYPGWLICPRRLRQELRDGSVHVWPTKASLETLPFERRALVLYELAWRHAVAFWPLGDLLADLLAEIADPARRCDLSRHRQLEIAAMLLDAAREADDGGAFERWAGILETHAEPGSDLRAEATYQRLLRARDALDYMGLSERSDLLRGQDPVWHLRRAALRCECGDLEGAGRDIAEAITTLRERLEGDRSSLWVRSRLAWALWLAGALRTHRFEHADGDDWPAELREDHDDPWEQVDEIRRGAADAVRKQREKKIEIMPLFDPGQYKDRSSVTYLTSMTNIEPVIDLVHLADRVGIPILVDNVSLLSDAAKDAAETVFQPTSGWYLYLLRALSNYSDPLIERYFGRVAMARLPVQVVTEITERVTAAVDFWRRRMRAAQGTRKLAFNGVEQLRLYVEVLSRLTSRRVGNGARADFSLAADLARDPALQHPWLFGPIEHLAERSLSALPPQEQTSLVLEALEFPLPDVNMTRYWKAPSPVGYLFGHSVRPERPSTDPRWDSRIKHLIENVGAENQTRTEAVLRLAYLTYYGVLKVDEREALGHALWSKLDDGQPPLPRDTGLLPHVLARLPAPEGHDAEEAVQARLFDAELVANDRERLEAIAMAAQEEGPHKALRPTREQALRLFDEMATWRERPIDAGGLMEASDRVLQKRAKRRAGETLAFAVVPQFASEDFTEARVQSLLAPNSGISASSLLPALPYLVMHEHETLPEVTARLRRAMVADDFDEVAGAVMAVETWARLEREECAPALPQQLTDRLMFAIETQQREGLQGLVWCARKLVEAGKLSGDTARLNEALGDLLVGTGYDTIEPESRAAITISVVRAECVRLARVLEECGAGGQPVAAWLEAATADPLPEVRFALTR
ncbi:MAG: hypothetical protein RQ966_20595, partial [Acetobacteraceae bacterium]|nr:hypothetical protein [Acetobacteraceae bacterium]